MNSFVSEELCAKGRYMGFVATQKATQWTEMSPAERTCLQACREQVPNGIAISRFLMTNFDVFALFLAFIVEFSRRRHQQIC